MKKIQLATFLLTVLFSNTIALPSVDHCLKRFEDSLKETMLLKKTCGEANLKDCCQVRYIYIYTVLQHKLYYKIILIYIASYICLYLHF